MIIINYQHSHHSRIENSRKPRQALRTFHPVEVVEFMNIMAMIQRLILMKIVVLHLVTTYFQWARRCQCPRKQRWRFQRREATYL